MKRIRQKPMCHMNGMFVIDGFDHSQRVYFSERGILYQLFVENSEEGKEMGKKTVEYMSE